MRLASSGRIIPRNAVQSGVINIFRVQSTYCSVVFQMRVRQLNGISNGLPFRVLHCTIQKGPAASMFFLVCRCSVAIALAVPQGMEPGSGIPQTDWGVGRGSVVGIRVYPSMPWFSALSLSHSLTLTEKEGKSGETRFCVSCPSSVSRNSYVVSSTLLALLSLRGASVKT